MNNQKPQLIILPGWGGTKETWVEFSKLAEKDFNVVCFNLPCFGNEPCPKIAWGVEEYSFFVKSKILELEVESHNFKPILMGHSFGGQVATYLVANNPDLVSKLVLSGPAVFRANENWRKKIIKFIVKIGKKIFKLPFVEKIDVEARELLYKAIGSRDYHETSGIKRDIFKKIIRQDLTNELSKINIPTLIIWGSRDTYVPIKDAYKLNKLIKNSRLKIVKGGKHGLHLQQPENLYKLVYDFSY